MRTGRLPWIVTCTAGSAWTEVGIPRARAAPSTRAPATASSPTGAPIRGRCACATASRVGWRVRRRVPKRWRARLRRRRIYCAGYCDRSPVVLRPDGVVIGREGELASLPEIRSLARVAIVTERVARGEFHALAARARRGRLERARARACAASRAPCSRAIEASGERGRGGAGFPTGAKWRAAAQARGPEKVVIANGDEGDPGSFIDRVLLESDPHAVLEGLALCAFAIGARHGIVYVRSEYPRAAERVERAIAEARAAGLLGRAILGSDFDFDVARRARRGQLRVRRGDGAPERARGTARRGEAAAAVSDGARTLRPPDRREQRRDARQRGVDRAQRTGGVPRARHARRRAGPRRSASMPASRDRASSRSSSARRSRERDRDEQAGGARLAAVALGGPMGSVLLPDEWDVAALLRGAGARGISSSVTAASSRCRRAPTSARSRSTGSSSWPTSRAGSACPAASARGARSRSRAPASARAPLRAARRDLARRACARSARASPRRCARCSRLAEAQA